MDHEAETKKNNSNTNNYNEKMRKYPFFHTSRRVICGKKISHEAKTKRNKIMSNTYNEKMRK
ncbi:hypothetical protein E2C01_079677 [Portunus trituberculatus]|uniref:Uncharacterized protein n=1 Tax=Portunus trituberculatus TaxID=210409 RepID=A0A5B7IXM4_PORTR|nr:hypothetical protein [Portunus trituberculatus]